MGYFIENTFQNWTRKSADMLGSCFLYVGYSIPIEVIREQLKKIVSASPLWDGKVVNLQVTNLKKATMELRCLISARGSARCARPIHLC